MTTTKERARSRFLLEVALDQENLKARIAAKLKAAREKTWPPEGQLEFRERFRLDDKAVSYRQYQRWEAGESFPEWKWIEVISDALGLTSAELLADEDDAVLEVGGAVSSELGEETSAVLAAVGRIESRLAHLEGNQEILRDDVAQIRDDLDALRRAQDGGEAGNEQR